ncbi:MAG: Asp/Glu racemase, partial [Pseudomonadota bacterium]
PQALPPRWCPLAPECEAVFLSCTNLRTLDVIERIEAKIQRPVLSSNQVLAWHLCMLASVSHRTDAPGRLFREPS